MAKPTARVLMLLELLQRGGTHPTRELADRLAVDERTIRRYVHHLIELDVPVETVRGRHGGYRLGAGFRMPPLMLSEDEAVAIVVGLMVLGREGLDPSDAADAARDKVRRVLPGQTASKVDALLQTLDLTGQAQARTAVATDALLLIAEAVRDRRLVAFAYRSGAGRASARTLAPYGIVAHRGRWFVTGLDSDSREVRTFRVDRMVLPRALEEGFDEPPEFDAGRRLMDGIARTPRRHLVRITVRGSISEVERALPAGLATVQALEGGRVRVEWHAESLDWAPAVLLRLARPFTIEAPAELHAVVLAAADALAAAAQRSEGPGRQ